MVLSINIKGVSKMSEKLRFVHMGLGPMGAKVCKLAIEKEGVKAKVFTSIKIDPISEMYSNTKCIEAISNNEAVIFSGGTGNPFFTTDTAAALRSLEINADVLLKGTRVDGVYSSDPEIDPTATMYDEISFDEAIKQSLKIMDITAFSMCRENNLPIVVFNMSKPGNLQKLILGEKIGTLIEN